ncbi:MAG: hypothetical protein KAT17_02000 [Candidatus Aminicenantes bacterium]|nr:hypothetical protein [Candidatus Aminicenantes bacterium]
MLLQVSLSLNIFEHFTYEYTGNESDLEPGMRVVVPVGNRITTGWVSATHSLFSGKVKKVIGTVKGNYITDRYLRFARAVSESYFVSLGTILDYSLAPGNKSLYKLFFNHNGEIKKLSGFTLKELAQLSKDQPLRFFFKNVEALRLGEKNNGIHTPGSQPNRFILAYDRLKAYQNIINTCLTENHCVLLIVPDGLTAGFYKDLIDQSDLYYSMIKARQRQEIWLKYGQGKEGVVIGGLLAVMLPVKNLGCVISERAGSFLYQKRSFTTFNINHIAALRAETHDLPFIEGFSTFTSKGYMNRKHLHIDDIRNDKNINLEVRRLPSREKGVPESLIELLKSYYSQKKRILLIVNKKKSSQYLFCQKCKKIQRCPSCSGLLNVRGDVEIRCTRCELKSVQLQRCTICGNNLVCIQDISIASIKEMIKRKLSERDILTVTADDLNEVNEIIERIKENRIIISTPVLINPFFKNIFDVIVYLRPESIFNMNEYNTGEMIFSTISELKELIKTGGFIDVFSIFHFHYSLKLINQEEEFFKRELKYREWFLLPPGYNVYTLEIRSKALKTLGSDMRDIYSRFKNTLNIKQIYLESRHKIRGNFKGKIEIHCLPELIVTSGLLKKKNIRLELVAN